MTVTAIMVDGAFFLKRYARTYGKEHSPEQTAKNLFTMCLKHLGGQEGRVRSEFYRIFFYDCPPLSKKAHNPVTSRAIDFSRTEVYQFRTAFHKALLRQRKVALRLGRLADKTGGWVIRPTVGKELLSGSKKIADLTGNDVIYETRQKGVDMKMGLDIASLSYKKLVSQIILVAGDADFVPAAKFARREGIDVILDPMWQRVGDDLFEHIDGLKSYCPRPS
jgi:uncharacterized LabA/DUF88 family protein